LHARLPSPAVAVLLFAAPLLAALASPPAGAWQPSANTVGQVLSNPLNETYALAVAYNSTGEAAAAWIEHGTSLDSIWSARLPSAGDWSAPALVATNANRLTQLAVVVDDEGRATLVWVAADAAQQLYFARTDAGGSAFPATLLQNFSTVLAGYPAVSLGPTGNVFVSWGEYNFSSGAAWAALIRPNGSVFGPSRIDTASDLIGVVTNVADPSSSGATALWCRSQAGQANLSFARFTEPAGWSSPQVAASNISQGCNTDLRAASDKGGNITALASDPSARNLEAFRYAAGGSWGPATILSVGANSTQVWVVDLDMAPSGAAQATWLTSDNVTNEWSLYTAAFDTAAGWAPAERLVENASQRPSFASAISSDGSALVLFNGSSNASSVLGVKRYSPLANCGPASALVDSGFEPGFLYYLAIAVAPTGQGQVLYSAINIGGGPVRAVPFNFPALTSMSSPANGSHLNGPVGVFRGTTGPGATVEVGGLQTVAAPDGSFAIAVPLGAGANDLRVRVRFAEPFSACTVETALTVTFDDPLPGLRADLNATRAASAAAAAEATGLSEQLNATNATLAALRSDIAEFSRDLDATRADLAAAGAQANETQRSIAGLQGHTFLLTVVVLVLAAAAVGVVAMGRLRGRGKPPGGKAPP
jgi:hypothetical protein